MKDLNKKVSMLCPVCGNDQFESLNAEWVDVMDAPDYIEFRCSDCGAVITKKELIDTNSEKISIAIQETKEELVKEVEKSFKKVAKTWKLII